jgi:hypothetical protein
MAELRTEYWWRYSASNPIFALLIIDCMVIDRGVGNKITRNIKVRSCDVDRACTIVSNRDVVNGSIPQPKVIKVIQALQCEDGVDT